VPAELPSGALHRVLHAAASDEAPSRDAKSDWYLYPYVRVNDLYNPPE
jgi:hypothetical protein